MATWKKVLFEGQGGAGDHLFNANLSIPGGVTRSHTISSGSTFDINGPVGADFFLSQGQIRLGDSDFGGTINLQRSNSSVNVLDAEVQVDTEVVDINTHEFEVQLESNPSAGAGIGNFTISQTEEGNTDPRPRLVMQKFDPAPDINGGNALGGVFFQGYNTVSGAVNEQQTYVQVRGFADNSVSGSEDGRFEVRVADNGAQSEGAFEVSSREFSDDVSAVKIYGKSLRKIITPHVTHFLADGLPAVSPGSSESKQLTIGSSAGVVDFVVPTDSKVTAITLRVLKVGSSGQIGSGGNACIGRLYVNSVDSGKYASISNASTSGVKTSNASVYTWSTGLELDAGDRVGVTLTCGNSASAGNLSISAICCSVFIEEDRS